MVGNAAKREAPSPCEPDHECRRSRHATLDIEIGDAACVPKAAGHCEASRCEGGIIEACAFDAITRDICPRGTRCREYSERGSQQARCEPRDAP
jgi:hypothetical protein